MKTCKQCGVLKQLTEFACDRHKADGHVNQCKQCRRAYDVRRYEEKKVEIQTRKLAYRSANRHLGRAQSAAWARANPEARAAERAAYRARKVNAEGRYTAQDIGEIRRLQKGKCAVCASSLKAGEHRDHIVPLFLGGTNHKTNIQLLCPPCNLSKAAKHPIDHAQQIGRLL